MSFSLSNLKASVVVTSDTCSRYPCQDTSGKYVVEQLELMKFKVVNKYIVADEKEDITKIVKETVDDQENALTITVGGTGLCPRDITPEATSVLYDKTCVGIAVALHMASLRYTSKAALSRLSAGISGSCLIVNFPGKEKACKDCFSCLLGFLEHALEQTRYDPKAIELTHKKLDFTGEGEIVDKLTNFRLMKDSQAKEIPCVPSGIKTSRNEVSSDIETSTSSLIDLKSPQEVKTDIVKHSTLNVSNNSVKCSKRIGATQSAFPLLNYDHVLDIMTNLMNELQFKTIEIPLNSMEDAKKTIGSILACDLVTKRIIPPYQASTMDGYLLNVPNNLLNKLNVLKTIHAIHLDSLKSFQEAQIDSSINEKFFCCQINTGGRIPITENCHVAIVPFEDTSLSNSNMRTISICNIQMGKFIRDIGSDLNEKDSLHAGTVIGPPELAIILSMGFSSIKIVEKTTIGLFSSGDELVEPFGIKSDDSNKVMDVNTPMLATLFESRGFNAISLGILKDNPDEIFERITASLKKCDVLVITGGASMGTCDHMKDTILKLGGTIHFGRVNLKPGKPAALCSLVEDGMVRKFIFCLPGNPVSAYITSLTLVLPFLEGSIRNHLGHNSSGLCLQSLGELREVQLARITDVEVDDNGKVEEYVFEGRLEFVRATSLPGDMKAPPQVSISIKQQSSRLLSLRDCDWLIVIEPSLRGSKFLVGQLYPALLLRKNH